jgi:hypothetical protein
VDWLSLSAQGGDRLARQRRRSKKLAADRVVAARAAYDGCVGRLAVGEAATPSLMDLCARSAERLFEARLELPNATLDEQIQAGEEYLKQCRELFEMTFRARDPLHPQRSSGCSKLNWPLPGMPRNAGLRWTNYVSRAKDELEQAKAVRSENRNRPWVQVASFHLAEAEFLRAKLK